MTTISRPAFSYYGSKWRMASTIIGFLPHHDCYNEPYGGSGAVILQKDPASVDVFNDKNRDIVNFFCVLRERPDELIRAIALTPMARADLALSNEPCEDAVERARRFYVCAWQSRGGVSKWRSGWRYERTAARGKSFVRNWNEVAHLWDVVARLKMLQIECDDAVAVIERFDAPTTVHYVDPPYPVETRHQSHIVEYDHDMVEQDHVELAKVLHGCTGGVILSSYPCELYDHLYDGWQKVEIETRTRTARKATEVLWLSPRIQGQRMPLFRGMTVDSV